MICFDPNSRIVSQDVVHVMSEGLPWRELKGKTVAITGAAGMLAAYVVETLLAIGEVRVVALVRNLGSAKKRFVKYLANDNLEIRVYDCMRLPDLEDDVAVILHAASLPRPDVEVPVDVLRPNLLGTYHLLEWTRNCPSFEQFIYFSSAAVYGEMNGLSLVGEEDGAHVDPANIGNCYSLAKMAGEALCAAYGRQYGVVTKMLRYAHTYGPGMDLSRDPRAFSEFFRNAIEQKDIRLQTSGSQRRSYCYISDATLALFRVLFFGAPGRAYNVVNVNQTYSIREFAQCVADVAGGCIRVLENGVPIGGYAPQHQTAFPDPSRLNGLGWFPSVVLQEGVERTLSTYRMQ